MEILRKYLKEMERIENIMKEVKNAFDELTSTLDTAEETEFEDMSAETSKMKKQKKKLEKKSQNQISNNCGISKLRYNNHIIGIPEKEGRNINI